MEADQAEGLLELARYYDEKTTRLLDKYGPGPRVHYHTGISDGSFPPGAGTESLRVLIRAAQERLLEPATAAFAGIAAPDGGPPRILDVGCGLGGTSLRLAQELGARMTAISIAAGHLPLVRAFAAELGLADRVEALVQDAHTMTGQARFDAAIAIESSCYLDRSAWLRRMAGLLAPGGLLLVMDWMLGRADGRSARVEAHWRTRMGTPTEYREAAESAGLVVESEDVINDETVGFWRLARAWNEAELHERKLDGAERARLEESARELANLEESFRSRSVLCVRMRIRRPGAPHS